MYTEDAENYMITRKIADVHGVLDYHTDDHG